MKLFSTILFILLFTSSKANNISVLTYNVNYKLINKKIIPVLDEINADIMCLQEVTTQWEKLIREGLESKYKHIKFRNSKASGGLAILSKYPIVKIQYLKNYAGWFRAALITIKKEENTLQLLNVHLKPPLSNKGLIGWNAFFKAEEIHVKELQHFMDSIPPNNPTLILGDFNESDKGKSLAWIKNKHQFKNALPLFDKRTKTWRFIFLKGRYDHILFNNRFNCTFSRVYKKGKSDHFPVLAHFKII
ncbi:MAG: endonuclease/exonuclease/phosphatase family protein [Vicingaceae bacterium]